MRAQPPQRRPRATLGAARLMYFYSPGVGACAKTKITFSLITNQFKGVGISVGVDGGHTVVAHGGQQEGQGPRPCSSKGARGDDRQTRFVHCSKIT